MTPLLLLLLACHHPPPGGRPVAPVADRTCSDVLLVRDQGDPRGDLSMVADVSGMRPGMDLFFTQRLGRTTQPDGLYPARPSPPPGVGLCAVTRGELGITYFPRLLPAEGTQYQFECLDGERAFVRCSVRVEPLP